MSDTNFKHLFSNWIYKEWVKEYLNIKLEKGDTFSVPLNSKIDISCNNSEISILNFVSQI